MQLPPNFLEELRARTPLAELIGGRVRLSRSGRQWKGCCPFHDEKTPSFQVYDDHFHCYGCGAHGDAVSFMMQSQGLSFMEAVTALASRAGLAVPQPSAEAEAAQAARQDAFSVLEAAARYFERKLWLPEGRAAIAYLRQRGLSEQTIRDFALGWSGQGRGALLAELAREGFSEPRLLSAGLVKEDDNSKTSEFFFNRIMFPIRDYRGRIVSFGGRVLGDGQPKYLNGPETELFAKRRSLYGLDRARAHLRNNPPIVVEGYMDVIALHQAGFPTAVAPLGTALTEEQLQSLWRLAEAPVICFDGDVAGRRAAARAIDLALPFLSPDQKLAFALLDGGEDPDSLIRKGRTDELRALVDEPTKFEDAHFMTVRERTGDTSWDERAKLLKELKAGANRISDPAAREHYGRQLRMLFDRRYPRWQPDKFHRGNQGVNRVSPLAARAIGIGHRRVDSPAAADLKRARYLTAMLIQWPRLLQLPRLNDSYARLELPTPLDGLRHLILEHVDSGQELDSEGMLSALRAAVSEADSKPELEAVLSLIPKGLPEQDVEPNWWETHGWLARRKPLAEDKVASERALRECFDDRGAQRLIAIKGEEDAVVRGGSDDEGA